MHYNIKCVYCMKKNIHPDEVLFSVSEILDSKYFTEVQSQNTSINDKKNPSDNSVMSQAGGMGGKFKKASRNYEENRDNNEQQYLSGKDIKENDPSAKPIYKTTPIRKTLSEELIEEEKPSVVGTISGSDMIAGYEVDKLKINGKEYRGKFICETFYCPECHKKLLETSGIIPTYIIGMIGQSSAGKTVYLTIQKYLLDGNSKKFKKEFPRGQIFADSELTHLDTEVKSADEIHNFASRFSEKGRFPPTTQTIPSPHCIRINYKLSGETKNSQSCIICFRDVIGERYTSEINRAALKEEQSLREMVNIVKNADGLIVLTDPKCFDLENENSVSLEEKEKLQQMSENFRRIFTQTENTIPTICVVTKQDELFLYAQNRVGKMKNISATSSVIISDFDMSYQEENGDTPDLAYQLEQLSEDTKTLALTISEGTKWKDALEAYFSESIYVPISSIGSQCRILETNKYVEEETKKARLLVTKKEFAEFNKMPDDQKKSKIDEFFTESREEASEKIEPRFVELPLFYFLEFFHVIPPVYHSNSYSTSTDKKGNVHIKFRDDEFVQWFENYSQINTENIKLSSNRGVEEETGSISGFLKKLLKRNN